MKLSIRNVFIGFVVVVAAIAVAYSFFGRVEGKNHIDLSEVITLAKAGRVSKIDVRGNKLTVTQKNGEKVSSRKEEGVSILEILKTENIPVGAPDGLAIEVHKGGFGSGVGLFIGLGLAFLPLFFVVLIAIALWRIAFGRRNSQ